MARPVTLFTGQWAGRRSRRSPRRQRSGASTASSSPAGATISTSTRRSPTMPTATGAGSSSSSTDCGASRSRRTSSARPSATDRRPAPHDPAAGRLGRRRPEGAARRAAEKVKDTARAAARFGVDVVNGFTGSSTWHLLYSFPPNDFDTVEAGYRDFADRWNPIVDVFDEVGVRFALEVHPTEIAYDFVTTRRALDAIDRREGFGINFDPSHLEHQSLDSSAFIEEFADRIYHVHVKDSRKYLDGRSSILGGTSTSALPDAAGTSSRRGTETSTSSRSSGRSTASATRGRSRSSGRTPGWTANGVRRTRSRSSGAPTSRRPPWPSTPPTRGGSDGRGEQGRLRDDGRRGRR